MNIYKSLKSRYVLNNLSNRFYCSNISNNNNKKLNLLENIIETTKKETNTQQQQQQQQPKYLTSKKKRQHANPLGINYQKKIELPKWETIYSDISLPFSIDLGCSEGDMSLEYSILNKNKINCLGIDIRDIYIEIANQNKKIYESSLLPSSNSSSSSSINNNLYYICCNANVNILNILSSLPNKQLVSEITIFFPDPWFKKAHNKRRLVNQQLIKDIHSITSDNLKIYIQTDNYELFKDIEFQFEQSNLFQLNFYHNSFNNSKNIKINSMIVEEDDTSTTKNSNNNVWHFPMTRFEKYFTYNPKKSNNTPIHRLVYIKKKQ